MSGTVCFFSAIESQSHFDACVDAGVDRLLASYYALRKRNKNLLRDRARKNPKLKFFIDSGAHSFITDWEKFKDWKRDDFEKYIQGYVKWIRKNKSFIFCAVELDIDYCLNMVLTGDKNSTLGTAIVESWQRKYFQPLEKEGIPIVYVWHEERQLQGWEEMCQKFAYVGLPGELSKEKNFYQFRNTATKYSVKVHGFGATAQRDFSEAGWYSVDSSVVASSRIPVRHSKTGFVEYVSISEIYDRFSSSEFRTSKTELRVDVENMEVQTVDNSLKSVWKPFTQVVRHDVTKDIYRINCRGGKSVAGTEDHSFFKLTKTGKLETVTPAQLQAGDWIVSSSSRSLLTNGTSIDQELATLAGLWYGDGYVTLSDNVAISKQHQSEIHEYCRAYFSKKWTVRSNGFDAYSENRNPTAVWLRETFGRVGKEKSLEPVMSWDKQAVACFLKGYFSADGTAKSSQIVLYSSKIADLEIVQLLLETWDIRSNLSMSQSSGGFKPHTIYRLCIGDNLSKKLFAKNIGFLQKEQTASIEKYLDIRYPVSRGRRGLPVELLRSNKLFTHNGRYAESGRAVYKRDKKVCEISKNFHKKLLGMECELLEIRSVELESSGELQDVYDLVVPGVQRFLADGILAHNTSWKSGEMYGVFIDWDEKAEQLLFIAKDRNKRHLYRQKIIDAGCDADGIIEDSDYKAITKWNLIQCNGVHMYYRKKYRNRIFPYDLRLPPLEVMQVASRRRVKFLSNKILFDKRFPKHAKASFAERRKQLCAISLVQHGDYIRLLVDDECLDFLKEYFPGLCNPLVKDMTIFQKEMSVFLLPRQQKAMSRGILPVDEHDKRPKPRTGDGFDLADLIDPAPEPELLKLL